MRDKVTTVQKAIALIRDDDTVCTSGFVGCGVPDHLLQGLSERFEKASHPSNLTIMFAAGQGDGKEKGLNRIAKKSLIKRVIGGHWGLIPKMGELAINGHIQAYNLPQGCISQMYRDIAAGKPGTLSNVGLGTFVDPRLDGGKLNTITQEDIVELMPIAGKDWLFYKAQQIDVALIRATTADTTGNLSMEHEALTLDNLAMAMAARNSGGLVIAQVERIAERGSLPSREVRIPGIFVDCVVVAPPEEHKQTYSTNYSPVFAGQLRAPMEHLDLMALDNRKVIARRAANELALNSVVNLGIGMPEGVAKIAAEESILKSVTLTAEPGVIGGMPASGLDFGAAINAEAIIEQNQQFDFYDGGGLDLACLGLAQCDRHGNINVSKFGPKLAGAGGFINISQNAKAVVFMGTFTVGGLKTAVTDGNLHIVQEGKTKKFVCDVEHITFSGRVALEHKQKILYVTERCVFSLDERGLVLTEIAPGIDIERDILAQMDFVPVIDSPILMDKALFIDEPMGLRSQLVAPSFADRLTWDEKRDLLFIDFENFSVRDEHDIETIQTGITERIKSIGKRVDVVVNYDHCMIDEHIINDYVAMVKVLEQEHYKTVLRYSSSVFTRVKLGLSFMQSGLTPNLFKNRH